ncbi:MAG: ketoacyl reductase [Cytophagales bacterium CG18_big_fil_WC_8_21_14_2_50_42_9]|nr:MAG: ketoacyl reductase [Cytophagales bacterium CG18_big_fil_WC_8_21_14_2_50_42_9]
MSQKKQKSLWIAAAGAGALIGLRALNRRRNAFDFAGKTVLITGASRGLGLVMARQLAAEGANLAICARDATELEKARQELTEAGAQVLAVPCDIRHEREVNALVKEVENRFGQVDVLINNAGVIQVGPLENMSLQEYREAMDTHYWAPLYAMLAVLPGMKQRKSGRIVNIASVGGKISLPHMVPYSGSKFALVGLSEGFRAELKQYNIPVTTINPGLIRTGSPNHAIVKGQHQKEYAWFTSVDVFPLLSMSAQRTARKIIEACRYGEAELTLTLSGKLAALLHGISPSFIADYFGLINYILPEPGSNQRRSGRQSKSDKTPGWVESLNQKAAKENNEQKGK